MQTTCGFLSNGGIGAAPTWATGPGGWFTNTCGASLTGGLNSGPAIPAEWLPFAPDAPAAPGAAPAAAPVVVVDPAALARIAYARIRWDPPGIETAPPETHLVNLKSFLWVDPSTVGVQRSSASLGPVTVTVTARPVRMVWDMGNGDSVTCAVPGTPYNPNLPAASQTDACSYTYDWPSSGQPDSAYDLTATVFWAVTWDATGVDAGGDFGEVPVSDTVAVRVGEIQVINTTRRGP